MKLFYFEISQAVIEQPDHILWFPDPRHRRAFLASRPSAQFQGRNQPPRLGRADARQPQQFGMGTSRQMSERPLTDPEKTPGKLQNVLAVSAGT
jgi:hypothetical protein